MFYLISGKITCAGILIRFDKILKCFKIFSTTFTAGWVTRIRQIAKLVHAGKEVPLSKKIKSLKVEPPYKEYYKINLWSDQEHTNDSLKRFIVIFWGNMMKRSQITFLIATMLLLATLAPVYALLILAGRSADPKTIQSTWTVWAER